MTACDDDGERVVVDVETSQESPANATNLDLGGIGKPFTIGERPPVVNNDGAEAEHVTHLTQRLRNVTGADDQQRLKAGLHIDEDLTLRGQRRTTGCTGRNGGGEGIEEGFVESARPV